jgi:hypothetical protein
MLVHHTDSDDCNDMLYSACYSVQMGTFNLLKPSGNITYDQV